jgi:hypothetical protein
MRTAIVVLVLSTAGCTHLQQAPLVYSSKTSVGVDIATTSTETPGIAFNVGYKQVDAAYVPVAVARTCRDQGEATAATCSREIRLVTGNSTTGTRATSVGTQDVAKAERLTTAAKALEQATKAAEDAQAGLITARRAEEELTTNYTRLVALYPSALTEQAPPVTGEQTPLSPAVPSDAERTLIRTYPEALKERKAAVTAAETLVSSRNAELDSKRKLLIEAANDAANVARHDSYSVFGSFSGKADGKATGEAKVGLGKIFATGVASQNISDGLADAYRKQPEAAASCYAAVAKAQPDAATLLKLLEACQQQVSN